MANRFWIGGAGTWDSSSTTHWSATTGPGTPGASVPGSADIAIFDANSGGGTVVVNHASLNLSGLTMGAFTSGVLDFATNNNNVTISGTNGVLDLSGTATRRIDMGNGTWTFSGANATFSAATATGLTFNCNGSTLLFAGTGATATRTISLGGQAFNIITFAANNGFPHLVAGSSTGVTLNIFGKNDIQFTSGTVHSYTNVNITGTAAAPALIEASSAAFATIQISTSDNITWAGFRQMTFTIRLPTATNSFDFGSNTGITIIPPSVGGGGSSFIG